MSVCWTSYVDSDTDFLQEQEWLNVAWKRWNMSRSYVRELMEKRASLYRAGAAEAAFKSPVRMDSDAAAAEAKAVEAAQSAANVTQRMEHRLILYRQVEARYFEIAPTALNFEEADAMALLEIEEARRAREEHTAAIRKM